MCLYLARELARENRYRRATLVAYVGVGAPALYTFLGGWLDSQPWIPYRGNGVWTVLWSELTLLTILERPAASEDAGLRNGKLAFAHGISAALITLFAVFHIANHLAGVVGGEPHIAVMRHVRVVYRQPVVEAVLGCCVLFQVVSGGILLFRRTRRYSTGWIEILQNASGAYLLLFFASHVSAVLRTRYLQHTDTNWIWLTADNLLTDPWSVRLVPNYFLAVLAFAVHGGCGLRWVLVGHGRQLLARRVLAAAVAVGGFASLVIIIALVAGSVSGVHKLH